MDLNKIYSTPDELQEPDFDSFMRKNDGDQYSRFDGDAYFAACNEHREKLAEHCRDWNRQSGKRVNKYVGKTFSFPVADGAAEYMVLSTSPLQVVHLAYVDGYQADDITMRGLRLADVKQQVDWQEKRAALFGGGS